MRTRAFLSLGSNLGDRHWYLEQAVETLYGAGDFVAVSPIYETEPIGGPVGQGPFLNIVVELGTLTSPRKLLERCFALEAAAKRKRAVRFGPRTLDADVLLVGDQDLVEEDLVIPHQRMFERRFVLVPLKDLAPDLVSETMLSKAGGEVKKVGTLDLSTLYY